MLQEKYQSKEARFSLWTSRVVWENESKTILQVVDEAEQTQISVSDYSINVNDLRGQLIGKLNTIPNVDRNGQEYKSALQKIEQALLRLEKQQEYFSARTSVLTDPVVLAIETVSVKSAQERDNVVQARAKLLKLEKLREGANVTEQNNLWEDSAAILEAVLKDYYNCVAAKCNSYYSKVSQYSIEAMTGKLTLVHFQEWSKAMTEYRTAIMEFRDSKSKNWPGTENLQFNDANESPELYYETEFNYFEAYKAAQTAKKVGDQEKQQSAEGWLAGAEQKKVAVKNYNLCRNQARKIKELITAAGEESQDVMLIPALQEVRVQAGENYANGVKAMDRNDWVRAEDMFLKALVGYKYIFDSLQNSHAFPSIEKVEQEQKAAFNAQIDRLAMVMRNVRSTVLYDHFIDLQRVRLNVEMNKANLSVQAQTDMAKRMADELEQKVTEFNQAVDKVKAAVRAAKEQNEREAYFSDGAKVKVFNDYLSDPAFTHSIPIGFRPLILSNLTFNGVMNIKGQSYYFSRLNGKVEVKPVYDSNPRSYMDVQVGMQLDLEPVVTALNRLKMGNAAVASNPPNPTEAAS